MNKPKFPIYIVSKGRWKRRPTANTLELMGVKYYIIVEEDEYQHYCQRVKGKVLILPKEDKEQYDTFWKDDDPRTGAGPARNFAWDHSLQNGHEFHWVMDDNIEAIERYNHNLKIKCYDSTPFYIMEDFVLRYKNVAIAGPNYSHCCPATDGRKPLYFNTRIYSTLLIRNDIPYRWRGRYNEDTDLSLRALKDGWCTVQFNLFLQGKRATQTLRGGNSEVFYDKEGTLKKSQMLVDMHPDCAKLIYQYNRDHHHVNYKRFARNILKFKDDYIIKKGVNEYGMKLIKQEPCGE